MDIEKVRGLLPKSANDEAHLYSYCKIISEFEPALREAFECFLETDEMPSLTYQGWTIEKITKHTHYGIIHSFIEMDKIMKDDEYCKVFGKINFGKK